MIGSTFSSKLIGFVDGLNVSCEGKRSRMTPWFGG